MKKIAILILTVISISTLFSQNDKFIPPQKGISSVFKEKAKGKFTGTVNGILILQTESKKKLILDFQGSEAELNLIPDEDEVYDVSTKKYSGKTTSGRSEVIYSTYSVANKIELKLSGKVYSLGIFDGAADMVINGINYHYQAEIGAEYLILHFDKSVELDNYWWLRDQMGTSSEELKKAKEEKETLTILANSVLVFAMKTN